MSKVGFTSTNCYCGQPQVVRLTKPTMAARSVSKFTCTKCGSKFNVFVSKIKGNQNQVLLELECTEPGKLLEAILVDAKTPWFIKLINRAKCHLGLKQKQRVNV